jgi:hypothetical protein
VVLLLVKKKRQKAEKKTSEIAKFVTQSLTLTLTWFRYRGGGLAGARSLIDSIDWMRSVLKRKKRYISTIHQ